MCQFAIITTAEPDRHLQIFDTGADAGKQAALLNVNSREIGSSNCYRVIRITADTVSQDWKHRERDRIVTGAYTPVPWNGEAWYHVDHFCHVSKDDPAQIAYTPSPEHGVADRQIRTRPGRYLTRFYSDVLTQDQIREWCAKYTKEHTPTALKFASDPDAIQWVYENGPTSCMSHTANDYESSCHPTRVYGAGDLAIAYVESRDSDDRVSARAICWPSKKIYGRMYGDENLLRQLLNEAGFSQSCNSSKWNGARLLRVEDGDDDDQFVAPYLDDPNYNVSDDGEFLRISYDGDIECRNTSGLADSAGRYTCANCEERCNETYTVDGDEWCSGCYHDASWRCYDCEDSFSGSPYTCDHRGNDICESCADAYSECVRCEQYFNTDALTYSEVMRGHYCERCASRYMVRTPCGEIADNEDDCDCDVCEDHRHENAEEDESDPPADPQLVTLASTSPTVHDDRQANLPLIAALNGAE